MKIMDSLHQRRIQAGALSLDLAMALGLLAAAVIPFAYSYLQQQQLPTSLPSATLVDLFRQVALS
jgi:hypothetical protein